MVLDRVSQPKNLAIAFNFAAQSFRSIEGFNPPTAMEMVVETSGGPPAAAGTGTTTE